MTGNISSNVGTDYYSRPTKKDIERFNQMKNGILAKYA